MNNQESFDHMLVNLLDHARASSLMTSNMRTIALAYIGLALLDIQSAKSHEERLILPDESVIRIPELFTATEKESIENQFKSLGCVLISEWKVITGSRFDNNISSDEMYKAVNWFNGKLDEVDSLSSGIVSAPSAVSTLISRMVGEASPKAILDPFCGTAGLLVAVAQYLRSEFGDTHALKISGFEPDPLKRAFAKLRLQLLRISDFRIEPFESFSTRNKEKFEAVVCMPPASLQFLDKEVIRIGFTASKSGRVAADTILLDSALKCLKPGGRAVFLVPTGILFRGGIDRELRQQILHSRALRSVVLLPDRLLVPMTAVRCALVALENGLVPSSLDKITLIDASELGTKQRAGTLLSTRDVESLATAIFKHSGSDALRVTRISSADISEDDLNLLPSTYMHKIVQEEDFLDKAKQQLQDIEQRESERLLTTQQVDRLIRDILLGI